MSMNNVYSTGTSSYLFPPGYAGLHGYYPLSGLVQGSKPPPLTMLSPAGHKVARNTATVPPLNQVSPSNGLTSTSSNTALNATRTSSFAAALRKLAYQAKDPADEGIKHSSPTSSNGSPRSVTPKRAPPPLVYSSQATSLTSPPVVTIAPTPSHQSHVNADMRQHGLDRIPSAHSTSSSYEPLALKQERDQRPLSVHSRDDDRSSKDGVVMAHAARITPHSNPSAASGGGSGREEGVTRGFQPYRHGEEFRPPVPPGFGMDPTYAAYHSALLASHYSHPAYRLEDPLLYERYRMMQPPFLPFSHPGMLSHPSVHPLIAGGRYPPELLHQYPYLSPGAQGLDPRSPAMTAERARLEEERQRELDREKERDREKEKEKEKWREKEREKEKWREKEKEKEAQLARDKQLAADRVRAAEIMKRRMKAERHELERREYLNHNALNNDNHQRTDHREETGSKHGSITQGTPRDILYQHHALDYKRIDNQKLSQMEEVNQHKESSRNMVSVEGHRRYEQKTDLELSRGQPPPLISPKEQGESAQHRSSEAIFRPFEKESRPNYSQLEVPSLHNRKVELSVPPLKVPQRDGHYQSEQLHGIPATFDRSNMNLSDKHRMMHNTKPTNRLSNEVSCDFVPNPVMPVLPVSKLDKEEDRLRIARLNGTYDSENEDSDFSEKEEDRIERLMLIKNGPTLPLDKSPSKLKFLANLGLYTVRRKKDKDFEKFTKRRKHLLEESLSPIIVEEDQKHDPSPLSIPNVDPDRLCAEQDYTSKCSFLASFNLQQLEREKKQELSIIREACRLEKRRRLGLENQSVDSTIDNKKGTKRKRGEEKTTETLESEPMKLTLGQLHQRNLSIQQNKVNNIHNKTLENGPVIFNESQERERISSREFAEQFHESVLQTTREKELAARLGNSRQDEGTTNQILRSNNSSTQVHHVSSDGIGGSSLSDQLEGSLLRWPGITAIMEAYQRHADEQRHEHMILAERCKKLQLENRDLNKKAELLSNRMSNLLEQKQQSEDERIHNQGAIENLKKPFRSLR